MQDAFWRTPVPRVIVEYQLITRHWLELRSEIHYLIERFLGKTTRNISQKYKEA